MQTVTATITVPQRHRAFGAAAVKTALLVGIVLKFTNQPEILRLDVTGSVLLQSLLNFLVPFLVAGYSRYALIKRLITPGSHDE